MNDYAELIALSISEKAYRVWTEGIYLACRHNERYAITLHAYKDYYAEVWYKPARQGITLVRLFRNTNQLEPFLKMISLKDL